MLIKQLLDLILVPLKDLRSLIIEGLLDVVELVAVVSAHLTELELHVCNQ